MTSHPDLDRTQAALDAARHGAARNILASIAAAGGSGARLLLLEFVVPSGDSPHISKISNLNMLAMTGGRERTETEWRELLNGAGFTGIALHHTGTPFSVIQATVP